MPEDSHKQAQSVTTVDWALTRGAAVFLLAFGSLPIASWIDGGLADPAYARRWIEWGYGMAICVGVGIVTAVLWRAPVSRLGVALKSNAHALSVGLGRSPAATDAAVAILCGGVYLAVAQMVFDGKPLLIDELVQVMQARMYAAGRLFLPTDAAPEFFSVLHMVDVGDRFYSQFPPGWPAMLAVGSVLDAEWMIGPICGAVSVLVFARLLRRMYGDGAPLTVAGGALLFGLGPFAAFQFASHMSHGPLVMWLLIGLLALSRVFAADHNSPTASRVWALAAGLAAGCAFAVRPLDAVAFAAPAAAWLFWCASKDRRVRSHVPAVVVGLAIPAALVMWVNVQTTGSPTLFGYEVLWGSSHGLGFHSAPWGDAHTPQRGLELLSLYVTRVNVYLFETPFPSLVPIVVALAIAGRLTAIERFLLVATGLHAMLYFAYWHDGFYLGPRFVMPWIPVLALFAVRLARHVARSGATPKLRAGIGGAVAAALVLVALSGIPVRSTQYRAGLASMRTDYGAEAARAGVTNALVFVRESWGAQLVARLWALGISRSATAALYSHVDACVLDHAVSAAERSPVRGKELEASLRELMNDSLLVRASTVSPDTTERMIPGAVYDSTCSARVMADRGGYALFPPFLLDRTSGNIYARDFQDRDSVLLNRYRDRRAFVVRREGVDGTSPLVWIPIAR